MTRTSQQVGAAFEAVLESHHDMALRLGVIAHVMHNQAITNVVKGRLIYTKKGGADYSLVLADARAGAVEAKTTKGTSLDRSEIDVLQAKHLDAVSAVGGLALLAVEFRLPSAQPERFRIPWREVPWKTLRTAESLSLEDCREEWKIGFECYLARYVPEAARKVVGAPKRVYSRE